VYINNGISHQLERRIFLNILVDCMEIGNSLLPGHLRAAPDINHDVNHLVRVQKHVLPLLLNNSAVYQWNKTKIADHVSKA
jgi:hypothetical protein